MNRNVHKKFLLLLMILMITGIFPISTKSATFTTLPEVNIGNATKDVYYKFTASQIFATIYDTVDKGWCYVGFSRPILQENINTYGDVAFSENGPNILLENYNTVNGLDIAQYPDYYFIANTEGTYKFNAILCDENTGIEYHCEISVSVPPAKKTQNAVIFSNITKTYGDNAFIHTASGGSGTGTFSYTSSDPGVATIDPATGNVIILKKGTTTLTATKAGDSSYFSASQTSTLTIDPKALTATAAANPKSYDGNTSSTGTINLAGVETADTGEVTASGTFTFTDAGAGTNKTVNVTDITLGGTKKENYTVNSTATAAADITKANISGISFSNANYTYDGTEKTIQITGTLPAGASVSYSGNNGTDAGTYAATATIAGGENYNNKTLNATLTINKANITTATFNNATYTYDGTAKTILVTGLPSGTSVSYVGNAGTNVGTYNATATIAGGKNYNDKTLNATLTINKADITTATFSNLTDTYDGTAKAILATGIPEGASVTYSNNTKTNAGTYTATATITGGTNYKDMMLNAALIINKATLTATVGNYSKTYGEENPSFTVNVTGFVNSETTATAAGYAAPTASTTATATTDKGTAAITISGGAATNYTINTADTGTLTINPKLLAATATANSKTYDGNTTATGTISLAGKVGTDDVSASGTFAFTDANFGTGKTVNVTGITLGGTKAGNYTVNDSTTATASINKADVSGISFNNSTVTYDGTEKTIEITGTLPAGVNVSYSGNNGTDAGTYTATATIAGGDNYNDKILNATLTINKADITTAAFNNATYTYDGTAKTILVTGLPSGTSVSYVGNAGTNAGTYNATATITGGKNYNDKILNATLTISKADITTAIFSNLTETYDGTAKTILATGIPEGASVTYSNNTKTSAGTYTATATITGGTNYKDMMLNATLTINKATLTATVGNYIKTYGEENPAFAVEVTGFVNVETAATAAGYAAPTASTAATATTDKGTAAITISGGAATNYTFNTTDSGTLTINPKQLTATATVNDKTYDGNTSATGTISLTGVIAADTGKVNADGTFAFAASDAGTAITVNVTNIALNGSKAENYSLSKDTATAAAVIKAKPLTVTISVNDKAYDGTTAATGVINLTGIIGEDDVKASGTFTFETAAVGAGKTVNVTNITLTGAKAKNYALSNNTATAAAEITKQLKSIAVTTLPGKVTYKYGEVFDPAGGVVTVTYTDASTSTATLTSDMCSAASIPEIGEKVVTVTYLTKATTFNVTYNKAEQTQPEAPVCSATEKGIIVSSPVGKGYEYSKDGGLNWQTAPLFTGLIHATPYSITVRLSETSTLNASQTSAATAATFMDITSPTIKAGAVTRLDNNSVTIRFTSDEAGQYYYAITADGAAAPAINTSGAGIVCTASETSIVNPLNLTAGAKDIYIKVKDAAGNVSSVLKIDIPEYVAPASDPIILPPAQKPAETVVEVLVNGKVENAGTETTQKVGDKIITTIKVDDKKLNQKLEEEGRNAVITIPVNNKADTAGGELTGQMIKNMETKDAVVEIKSDAATYSLPASQINISAVSEQIGKSVELKDIKVQIQITKPANDVVKVVENSAKKGEFSIMVPPLDFTVKCTNESKTIEIHEFNAYVERTVAIPEGVDPSKITTGIIVEADGTTRHVPTKVVAINGKYYAKINSLTNSIYSVIWHPLEFKDAAANWAKEAINDMGSRMVISGTGDDKFEPDRDITRAEFAAIIVRALGLKPGNGNNPFIDVKASDWYCDYVKTAVDYNVISGYGNGKFGPMDKITREQAMSMIARAMKITGLKAGLSAGEGEKLLSDYSDSKQASVWARESMAACVKTGILSGKNGRTLAPRDEITRAEVAVIVRRLLQKSNLI